MPRGYHIRITVLPPAQTPSTSSSYQRSHFDPPAFIPSSIFQSLPTHPPKPSGRRYTIHHHKQPARQSEASTSSTRILDDYRFGPIRLDWMDFDNMDLSGGSQNVWKEKSQGSKSGPATAKFVPVRTKSGSTNLPEGVVHIYREVPKEDPSTADGLAESSSAGTEETKLDVSDPDGVMMGVLAVPSWMTPSDFLAFVAPAAEGMAHLRMIRDSVPNRSMVVIKFRKREDAAEFAEAYNGKQFNAMEAEICHVVRILSVNIETNDAVSQAISRLGSSDTTVYELPTCPVCLERMDSAVTGLVTVPCSHTFHCACLSKWGDSRCPVCRYSQTLLTSHPTSANTSRSNVPIPFASAPSNSRCADCPPDSPSTSNLWICLICGNLGCGRYGRAHAHAHYEATTHLYALELDTQRVWDYAGDGYVHRLIQNKADGKLVELPSASRHAGPAGPSSADALSAEKIEAIGIEYSYLLSSQLDSQRAFYETQLSDLRTRLERLESALTAQDARRRDEDSERVAEADRAREKAERAAALAREREEKAAALAKAKEKELQEERAVSAGLLRNLAVARERAEAAEKEKTGLQAKIGELEDQVRDIMFFVEARDKVAGGEAAGGSLEVKAKPDPPAGGVGRRKKGKKG